MAMASRLIREYGEKSLLAETDAARLSKDLAIPIGKAMQIVAAGELGRRLYAKNEADAQDFINFLGNMSGVRSINSLQTAARLAISVRTTTDGDVGCVVIIAK